MTFDIITIEHVVMVLIGGFGVWTLERRLGRLVGDRLTRIEERLNRIEKKNDGS